MATKLSSLRQELAEARMHLRETKEIYAVTKAQAESIIIARLGDTLGKNAESRERNLLIQLEDDMSYRVVRQELRLLEDSIDRLEAALETELDERRAEEWRIRARLADALLGQPGRHEQERIDGAQDAAVDRRVDRALRRTPVTVTTRDSDDVPF
jgi:hypothetical protein